MHRLLFLLEKARTSRFYLWLLNAVLWRVIPFNKPHRIKITSISDYGIELRLPYRRRNLNHVRGLHACALATVAEYATGLLLISRVKPSDYRLIMQAMDIRYHYQGKLDGVVRFSLTEEWLATNVFQPLREEDAVVIRPEVSVQDSAGNHLMTGIFTWQIKSWAAVRTPVR